MIRFETDSRNVKPGSVFVAIKGHTVDGHDYVDKAIQNGAIEIIAEKEISSSVPVIVVPNTEEYLKEKLKTTNRPIKASLLDQSIIAGIGNIYADEILFLSNINPERKSNSIKDKEMYYVLLDEIQKVEDFEAVLNGFLHIENLDVYVTGSNSKFLSSDIITEFRGRGDEIKVYPLTYGEFYSAFSGDKANAWDEYIMYGGLPGILSFKTEESKKIT